MRGEQPVYSVAQMMPSPTSKIGEATRMKKRLGKTERQAILERNFSL